MSALTLTAGRACLDHERARQRRRRDRHQRLAADRVVAELALGLTRRAAPTAAASSRLRGTR